MIADDFSATLLWIFKQHQFSRCMESSSDIHAVELQRGLRGSWQPGLNRHLGQFLDGKGNYSRLRSDHLSLWVVMVMVKFEHRSSEFQAKVTQPVSAQNFSN